MHSKFANFLKATIIDIIVALFVLCTIVFVIRLIFGAKLDETISIVSKFSISTDQKEIKPIEFENKKLKNWLTMKKSFSIITLALQICGENII